VPVAEFDGDDIGWGLVGGGRRIFMDDFCSECGKLACSCAGRSRGQKHILSSTAGKFDRCVRFRAGSFARGKKDDYRDDLGQFLTLRRNATGKFRQTPLRQKEPKQKSTEEMEREPFHFTNGVTLGLFGY
jgi:hypothetical protein